MQNPDDIEVLIEAAQWDDLEDIWLGHATENPPDLDFFAAATEMLAAAGERERASFLLEILDEQITESRAWKNRLDLLEKLGPAYLPAADIHSRALDSLRGHYGESVSLDGLIEKVGLHRAVENTKKNWQKIDRLRSLMRFEIGSVVLMQGKGAGRVVELNLDLESLKIDLEQHPSLRVGFAAAAKMLSPLAPLHILRRKMEDPESLLALAEESPGELLRVVLESSADGMTAGEVRKTLEGIVETSAWTSWWNAARRHPQVLNHGSGSRQIYSWASSEDDATASVREAFMAADLDDRLEIYRKNKDRLPDFRQLMQDELATTASDLLSTSPSSSLLIWFTLDRTGDASASGWSPTEVLTASPDPASLILEIQDRALRERLYQMTIETRPDWTDVFARALDFETDPRPLTFLADHLAEVDPDRLKAFRDDLLSHPRKRAAAFTWLSENADQDVLVEDRNPLRLLRQIFDAIHQNEFAKFRSRLLKTLEKGGAAVQLLTRLSAEQAAQAEQAFHSAPLEEHVREALIRTLHLRYPELDGEREMPLYATTEAIEARRQELKNILEQEIPTNRKAIQEARELGDLSENFEYKSARQRHEYLTSRAENLQRDLSRAQPFEVGSSDLDEVRIGCRLNLSCDDGKQRTLTILGPWESDPDRGVVSYDSDLGKTALGKRPGDTVEVDGVACELTTIEPWR